MRIDTFRDDAHVSYSCAKRTNSSEWRFETTSILSGTKHFKLSCSLFFCGCHESCNHVSVFDKSENNNIPWTEVNYCSGKSKLKFILLKLYPDRNFWVFFYLFMIWIPRVIVIFVINWTILMYWNRSEVLAQIFFVYYVNR